MKAEILYLLCTGLCFDRDWRFQTCVAASPSTHHFFALSQILELPAMGSTAYAANSGVEGRPVRNSDIRPVLPSMCPTWCRSCFILIFKLYKKEKERRLRSVNYGVASLSFLSWCKSKSNPERALRELEDPADCCLLSRCSDKPGSHVGG